MIRYSAFAFWWLPFDRLNSDQAGHADSGMTICHFFNKLILSKLSNCFLCLIYLPTIKIDKSKFHLWKLLTGRQALKINLSLCILNQTYGTTTAPAQINAKISVCRIGNELFFLSCDVRMAKRNVVVIRSWSCTAVLSVWFYLGNCRKTTHIAQVWV